MFDSSFTISSFWPLAASASASVGGTSFWWSLATAAGCPAVQTDQIPLHVRISRRSRSTRLTRDTTTSSISSRTDTTCGNLEKKNRIVRITVKFTQRQ